MTLNRLKGLCAYLSGPIDHAVDKGAGWREDITPFLDKKNVKVLNPLKHCFWGVNELPEKRKRMASSLQRGDFSELREEMKGLVHLDLRAVDLSSFLVVNYDSTIHMCGTYEEIFIASKQPKRCLPSW